MSTTKNSKFRFNRKTAFLTFKSHLKLDQIKKIFAKIKGEVRFSAVHETSDTNHNYDHTHILVFFINKPDIRDERFFDIGDIHPHIKKVMTKKHWSNLLEYITKQNVPFYTNLTGNEYEWLMSVREVIQSKYRWEDVINDDYLTPYLQKYFRWCQACFDAKPKPNLTEDLILRDWQKKTLNILQNQNDRKILWIYDKKGGMGKSTLTNYMIDNNDAFFCNNGATKDISYAYNYEKTVIFDLPRSTIDTDGKDWTPYRTMEMFKDGRLFSSKYQSKMKRFSPCKVVVFANFKPDRKQLTEDRWQVWDLGKNPLGVLNIKEDSIVVPEEKKLVLICDDLEEITEIEISPMASNFCKNEKINRSKIIKNCFFDEDDSIEDEGD